MAKNNNNKNKSPASATHDPKQKKIQSKIIPPDPTETEERRSARLTPADITDTPNDTTPHQQMDVTSPDSTSSDKTNTSSNTDHTKPKYYEALKTPVPYDIPSPCRNSLNGTRILQCKHKIMYTLTLNLPKSKDIMKTMQLVLREWFKAMK